MPETLSEPRVVPAAIEPVLRRLNGYCALSAAEAAIVRRLQVSPARHPAGAEVLSEGQMQGRPAFVTRGWAACLRTLADGRRQIFRLVLPGDIVGLEAGRGPPGWSVAALGPLDLTSAAPVVEAALSDRGPNLARALALGVRQEERLLLDQVVRLGCLTGPERMAHLFLELRDRLRIVGLGDARRFPLPLTQEVIADVLGLSVVHVNRILKSFREQGQIELRSGMATLLHPDELEQVAGRKAADRIVALTA